MSKKINLFGNTRIVQNEGVKYSDMLMQMMNPFEKEFGDTELEDAIDMAVNAWNIANMQEILPKDAIEDIKKGLDNLPHINSKVIKKMIEYKLKYFSKYTNFIRDYEITTIENADPVLTVIAEPKDQFLVEMLDQMEPSDSYEDDDYDQNYINRIAIIIKPLKPLVDWYQNLYPEDTDFEPDTNIYLLKDDKDIDTWLKKKFDQIFQFELEIYHLNKKEWPQKRNYKMFKEWFEITIVPDIFDFEKTPVSKSLNQ
ncbi:hypothetical protein [Riemerella columbina]|uniref:hypothetical protein n=1 Tax=Riemerella columbina TaxID=103810 RepID=UPI0003A270D2|nr:hypothetical protein [Riemerella columbina]